MKKTITLSEAQLRNLIKESVSRIISEAPSTDTAWAARNAALNRLLDYEEKYGATDPRTERASEQFHKIADHYYEKALDDQESSSEKERAKINRKVRNGQIDRGELKYEKGKGWRKQTNESRLRKIVRESVKKILGETEEFDWSSLDKPTDLDALAMLRSQLDADAKNNPRQKRVYDDDPEWNEFVEQDLDDLRNGRRARDTYSPTGGEYDPYEKFLDNELSWEEQFNNEPGEGEIDHYIGQNNNRLYGDEYKKDNVGKKARDKWVGGASPDYMEGWTDAALGEAIKKTVKNVINEIKADDPHENLRATNDALEGADNIGGLEDALAELMVDNNLTFEDVKQYDNLMRFIDPQQLDQEIDRYKNFLEQDRLDDKRREAQAWAEEEMSDMGFGYEDD